VWFGLLLKKARRRHYQALHRSRKGGARRPRSAIKLEAQGFDVVAETGPQLLPNIKEQIARWGKLVERSSFSAEDRGSTR
jgi:hypothetical protein